jgi:L,D-transpeptidase YcbB
MFLPVFGRRHGLAASVSAFLACSTAAFSQDASGSDIILVPDNPDQGVVVEPVEKPRPVLFGDASLLRDAIESDSRHAALVEFYEARDYEPVWTPELVSVLVDTLSDAGEHGLPVARYAGKDLGQLFASNPSGIDRIKAEIAASEEFVKYAHDIGSGILEPNKVDSELYIFPKRKPDAELLAGLTEADDTAAYLASLAPSHPYYKALFDEKKRLEALIQNGGWGEQVAGGPTLKPGASSARVAQLRTRLDAIDGTSLGESTVFDQSLIDAVKAFQLRHGLNDDGVVGPKTLEAINTQPDQRLKQVIVNLERQRWLNFDRGERYFYVNQADFMVTLYEKNEPIYVTRAVVGQAAKHRTPEFIDEMTHMVVNPTWHVPRSIATEEMLPQLKRNPGALGNMALMTRSGTRVNPALVDFSQFTKANFPFVIKQPPSGGNALGRVKFMFPNRFDIYLHDTPAKSLFSKDARAFSHGCIRLQKPFELAHMLLGWQTSDPVAAFDRYLAGGNERRVDLAAPIPIILTYQTAWVDNFGEEQFRDDIYGRDRRVFDALEAAGVSLNPVEG